MAKKLDQKMLAGFVRETRLYLPEMQQGLEQFQQDATQREGLEEALGYAHTIKGACIMVGFPVLSHLAAYVEDTLQEVVGGQRPLDTPCMDWFHHVFAQIDRYLEGLLAGDAQQPALVTAVVQDARRFQGLPEAGDAAAIAEALSEQTGLTPARPAAPVEAPEAPAAAAQTGPVAPQPEAEEEEFSVELLSETVEEEDAAALEAEEQARRLAAAEDSTFTPTAERFEVISAPLGASEELEALISSIDHDVHRVYGQEGHSTAPLGPVDRQAERYVLFTLAGSRYAVPVPHVLEIGRIPHITPVPNVPTWVRGVVNLRGDILSVIDFRTFLGLEDTHHNEQSRMLVVKTAGDEMMTSLIVDQVTGIVPLAATRLDLPEAPAGNKTAAYLRGAYEYNDQVCAVFDLERLLLSPEVRQFE